MSFAVREHEEEKFQADNHALVAALARAWPWQAELTSNHYDRASQALGFDGEVKAAAAVRHQHHLHRDLPSPIYYITE